MKRKATVPGRRVGDRIVQVVLLLLIAGGIAVIAMTLKSGGDAAGSAMGMPGGGPPGGGAPGTMVGAGDDESESAVAVEVAAVDRSTVREYIRVNGDVLAERTVTIYPDASGKVIERTVSVGQYVRRDQQIAVVDPSQPGQRYSHSPVLSTIAGTVTAFNVQIGDTVTESTAIASVGDLTNLQIVTYVPERYVDSIRVGLVADVTFEAFPDETFSGRVIEVSPVLDTTSRTVEAKLALTRSDPRVKAGMFASVRLVTKEAQDTLVVPTSAITSYYGEQVVYVVNSDNSAERRSIQIGLQSQESVQILDGLTEGESVVTAGLSQLTDGTAVTIVGQE